MLTHCRTSCYRCLPFVRNQPRCGLSCLDNFQRRVSLERTEVGNYNENMRRQILYLFLFLMVPSLAAGQSLTEVAAKEKERRKKNKESGKQVSVITDTELAQTQGRIANPTDEGSTPSSGQGAERTGRRTARRVSEEDEDDEEVTLRGDASLQQKLEAFEAMKASYQEKVKEIDEEIRKNNKRISEIQQALVSTGGTGLPTAPQADMQVRNPADIPAMRQEQAQLREKNQQLEARKKPLKDDLIAKGRRAGIPARYLTF